MKWSEQPREGGNFLKFADLQGKEYELVIASITQEDCSAPDQEPQVRPVVSFVGAEKKLPLNVTNGDILASAFGDDMDNWRGEKVILWGDPSVQYKGQRVGGVRVRLPARPPEPADGDDIPF